MGEEASQHHDKSQGQQPEQQLRHHSDALQRHLRRIGEKSSIGAGAGGDHSTVNTAKWAKSLGGTLSTADITMKQSMSGDGGEEEEEEEGRTTSSDLIRKSTLEIERRRKKLRSRSHSSTSLEVSKHSHSTTAGDNDDDDDNNTRRKSTQASEGGGGGIGERRRRKLKSGSSSHQSTKSKRGPDSVDDWQDPWVQSPEEEGEEEEASADDDEEEEEEEVEDTVAISESQSERTTVSEGLAELSTLAPTNDAASRLLAMDDLFEPSGHEKNSSFSPPANDNESEVDSTQGAMKRPALPHMDSLLSDITFEWGENNQNGSDDDDDDVDIDIDSPTLFLWTPKDDKDETIDTIDEEDKRAATPRARNFDLPFPVSPSPPARPAANASRRTPKEEGDDDDDDDEEEEDRRTRDNEEEEEEGYSRGTTTITSSALTSTVGAGTRGGDSSHQPSTFAASSSGMYASSVENDNKNNNNPASNVHLGRKIQTHPEIPRGGRSEKQDLVVLPGRQDFARPGELDAAAELLRSRRSSKGQQHTRNDATDEGMMMMMRTPEQSRCGGSEAFENSNNSDFSSFANNTFPSDNDWAAFSSPETEIRSVSGSGFGFFTNSPEEPSSSSSHHRRTQQPFMTPKRRAGGARETARRRMRSSANRTPPGNASRGQEPSKHQMVTSPEKTGDSFKSPTLTSGGGVSKLGGQESATAQATGEGSTESPTAAAQGGSNDPTSPHALLIMYLQSIGTDPSTAQAVATSFIEQQEKRGGEAENASLALSSNAPSSIRHFKGKASAHTSLAKGSDTSVLTYADASNMSTERSMISTVEPSRGFVQRDTRGREVWTRATRPGAVSMEGRAFGAPERPELAEGDLERGDSLQPAVVEAMAVVNEELPIVYADSKVSLKQMWKEGNMRKLLAILLVVVTCIVVTVSLLLMQNRGTEAAEETVESPSPSLSPSMHPTFVMDDLLSRAALVTDRTVLETPETPQRRAVGWLSSIDEVLGAGSSDPDFFQRYAMVVFFFSTHGEEWTDREDWLNPTTHECDWGESINCADLFGRRSVTEVGLTKQGLAGTLPKELGLLSSMQLFRCDRNALTGSLPESLFGLTRLAVVDVSENEFGGTLPESIVDLENLVSLDLSFNYFRGSLPETFYDLSVLRTLDIQGNQFNGTISPRFADLASLNTFNVRSNMISGPIPAFDFRRIPPVDFVYFDDNLLTGTLPPWVSALATRQEVTVSHNMLTGEVAQIPPELLVEYLTLPPDEIKLSRLDFSHNNLTGPIQANSGFFPNLEYLDFSHNSAVGPLVFGGTLYPRIKELYANNNLLTGVFPRTFPANLEVLDVSSNFFVSGVVSDGICAATNLTTIIANHNPLLGGSVEGILSCPKKPLRMSFANCSLGGTIPTEIAIDPGLCDLNLSHNFVTGTLPTQLGSVSALHVLDLSSNSIGGSIPHELGALSELTVLRLDNNKLSGIVPEASLEGMESLELLTLAGNDGLKGAVPCAVLGEIPIQHVGCQLDCACCLNQTDYCAATHDLRVGEEPSTNSTLHNNNNNNN